MLTYLNSSVPDLVTFERIPRHSKKHIDFAETVRKNPKVSKIPTSVSKPEVWISWCFIANCWKIGNLLQCLPTFRLIQSCGISCHFNRRKSQWKDLSVITSTWVCPNIGCPKIQLLKTRSYLIHSNVLHMWLKGYRCVADFRTNPLVIYPKHAEAPSWLLKNPPLNKHERVWKWGTPRYQCRWGTWW